MRPHHVVLTLALLAPSALLALTPPGPTEPDLPDGTDRALKAAAGLRPPAGMKVELFAAEPQLASPVAIGLDEKNRVFVAEEHRFNRGTEENRSSAFLLEDDLQIRTLDGRLGMYRKWAHKYAGGMDWFSKHADQVRLLEDTKGAGKADKSTVFAGGFNAPLDGLAAGVLARDGDVYFTCIPNLWKLRDTKNAGVADERTALLTGFGVNCAFLGHDLHGLIFGPDGKLYFSVGDRGYDVTTKEGRHLNQPRRGAVFRCDPDGKNLEVVMKGLRNPQELAFDQYGNLFADDNNCDKGDHARLVYVLEDGDAGWNMEYQTIPQPYLVGPWFAERLWHLPHEGQPAYILPPVGKIGTGPSGFLFTSGTSLADKYRNSFLMCNYSGAGGLESFKVVPKGAGFEIADYHTFMQHGSITDAEFGYDGKLYVSDFVGLDWTNGSKGGRIYTVFDPEKLKDPVVRETKALFAEGFKQRPADELAKLLGHADQRVRQRAQFALVGKGPGAVPTLVAQAQQTAVPLARLHAVWGLGQLARTDAAAFNAVAPLLRDPDPEVQAQALRVLGDSGRPGDAASVAALLQSPSARVRLFAAQTLGKWKFKPAIPALFDALAANKDTDPFLRHACVAALARIGDADAVAARIDDPNRSVRMGVVLILRRLGDKRIVKFLDRCERRIDEGDEEALTEAVRAIHDLPLEDLYPRLAELDPQAGGNGGMEAVSRRVVNACFRLGREKDVERLLVIAQDGVPEVVRTEAVNCLRDWADPPPRDRVTGAWRPLAKRDTAMVRKLVQKHFIQQLPALSGTTFIAYLELIEPLNLTVDETELEDIIERPFDGSKFRDAALRILAKRKVKGLEAAIKTLESKEPILRAEARDVLAVLDPNRGARQFIDLLKDKDANVMERQRAVVTLAKMKVEPAAKHLDSLAAALANGEVPPELRLEVWNALKAAGNATRDRHRKAFENSLNKLPRKEFSVSLEGGDAERGREIFFNHTAAQCVRCHKVGDSGGTAGPDLSDVVERHPTDAREYILESMVDPNAKIAPGFGSVSLSLADGRQLAGLLVAEDAKTVTVQTPDGKKQVVLLEDVERRTAAASPMPSLGRTLTPGEVRDLVAFLMARK